MPASLLTVTPLTASGISHVFYNIPPQGLVAWYDATQISGISSGTSLSAWTDLSGNGNHALQSGATRQPVFVTNAINGQAAVKFISAASTYLLASAVSYAQPTTVVFVSFVSSAVGGGDLYITDGATARQAVRFNTDHGKVFAGGSDIDATTVTWSKGTTQIGVCIFNGSTTTLTVGSLSSTFNGGANSIISFVMGIHTALAINPYEGLLGEVAYYNKALSSAEKTQIINYLASKWGQV